MFHFNRAILYRVASIGVVSIFLSACAEADEDDATADTAAVTAEDCPDTAPVRLTAPVLVDGVPGETYNGNPLTDAQKEQVAETLRTIERAPITRELMKIGVDTAPRGWFDWTHAWAFSPDGLDTCYYALASGELRAMLRSDGSLSSRELRVAVGDGAYFYSVPVYSYRRSGLYVMNDAKADVYVPLEGTTPPDYVLVGSARVTEGFRWAN